MNSINVVLTVIMFALFAVAGLLVKFPDKGDDLMVQLAKGQLFSEEGIYTGNVEFIEGTLEQRIPGGGGWKSITKGEKILSGMEIRTLADSKAVIVFDDKVSVLRMDEVTRVTFDNKLYQININLVNGFVYSKVGFATSRKYNIKTENYRIEATNANFAIRKDFQVEPELLIFKEGTDVFLTKDDLEERKGNFREGRKVFLRNEFIEEANITEDDYTKKEIIWNFEQDKR